jgi:hypothetical protein
MCDFFDENGNKLEVGDEIEYWSPSYKNWLKAQIAIIQSERTSTYTDDGQGGYTYVPKTKVKIKVARWNEAQLRYLSYGYQNLSSKANIRKV